MVLPGVFLRRLSVGWLLGILLATALVLRAGQLRESLWLDEMHTAWTIDGPPGVTIVDASGREEPLRDGGYEHFR